MITTEKGIVFGVHPVGELIHSGSRQVEKVLFEKGKHTGALFRLLKESRKRGIPCQVVDRKKIQAAAGKVVHQGILAYCSIKEYCSIEEMIKPKAGANAPSLLLAGDSIEDPRNLGALIRTAAGVGARGLVLSGKGSSGLTPAVAKAAAGCLEAMPIARPSSFARAIEMLKESGFEIAGLDGASHTVYSDLTYVKPVVVVVGGEDRGIRPHVKRLCDKLVSIPVAPPCQSLNLSVATGVLVYELIRSRKEHNLK